MNKTFDNERTPKKRVYLTFNVLFALNIVLFIFTLSQALILLMLALTVKQDSISYKEKGNVDYKVYLNANDFYDSDYLDKDMVYVSGLINNVNAVFNYDFHSSLKNNIKYSYEVIGEIVIYDSSKENVFFRKEYVLSNLKEEAIKDAQDFSIDKNIVIDYGYYNSLANRFRKNYGVSSKSDFIVKFKLKYNNDEEVMKISESKEMSLTIPLSLNEVNITTDNSKVGEQEKTILGAKHVVIDSSKKLVSSILLALIALFLLGYIIMTLFEIKLKKNKYDSFIKKTLREYDRLIVNTTTPPMLLNTRVIHVNSFQELLDVRDNLSIPIMYYVEEEHKRSVFYLSHGNEMFVLRVKEKDFNDR